MATTDPSALSLSPRLSLAANPNWIRTGTVLGVILLWVLALRDLQIDRMNDYGLISVVPMFDFIALAILTVSFCLALRDESTHDAVLLLHVVALVFMLFGIASLVEPMPRFESTWKHVGVTDYVIRHGSVDPSIDAYFNWPGFFVMLAFVTEVTGAKSALSFANWWPVAMELMYLPPLLMIFRRATDDRRLIWLAAWTFYIANWIGQDYLSPQGFMFFLYLVIIAVLITWFEVASDAPHPVIRVLGRIRAPTTLLTRLYRWIAPADKPGLEIKGWQREALSAAIIVMFIVTTIGHQLTPFASIAGAALLVVFYRTRLIGMPLLMILIAGLWLRFGASAYWAGHGGQIADQVGALDQSVGSNMTDRLSGSRGHEIVVYIRTAMTLAFWGLACLGGLRRISKGHRDFTFALLAAAPFPLIGAQSYGGEMLLRVYLFSLPFMAFFAAAIFYRSDEVGGSLKTTSLVVLVSFVALGLFFVTRYGNERQDYFTTNEVAAAELDV